MEKRLKERCRLTIGDSFIYRGYYCTVIGFRYRHFIYSVQGEPNTLGYMDYEFYLTTPSAMGRKLNYKKKHSHENRFNKREITIKDRRLLW
jgi:hypothetical protein